jgi:phage portal protein BeeE
MAKSLIGKILNEGPPIAAWKGGQHSYGGYRAVMGNSRTAYMNAMGSQGTLFAIVQLLSTGKHATGGWKLFRQTRDRRFRYARTDRGSDPRPEVLVHQALKLWNRPNDFMTGSDFREIGWQHMELAGEWYWVLNRGPSGNGVPIEMWPVRPDRMEPVPDKDKFLAGWVYTDPGGEAVPLSVDEVIQLRYPDPTDFYRGLSPVQALLADIDSAKYTAEYTRNFFLNSAQPGGIVTFNKRLTDEEFTEFTTRWREQHQGVARGHRVGVLEQGASWQTTSSSLRDMQLPDLRRLTSDHIRQGYRIHQAMLGDSTDVNRANAQTALEIHVAFHEVPRLDREKGVLNTRFLEMFGAQEEVEFDYPDPMPDNREEDNAELNIKATAALTLVRAGYDPHAVLECIGLPDMDTAVLATQSAALPPGWIALPPGTPASPEPVIPPEGAEPLPIPQLQKPPAPSAPPALPPGQEKAEPGQEPAPAHNHFEEFSPEKFQSLMQEAIADARRNGNGHKEKV